MTHEKLLLHPVGAAIVDRIERETANHAQLNQRDLDALDKKIQQEMRFVADTSNTRITQLERNANLLSDGDLKELRDWRAKTHQKSFEPK